MELVQFNKGLQNKLIINLDDYKNISNRYKIGEKNGIVKEYLKDTNLVIFEGEYKNGKRNGKGKEFYENQQIKFEGEYINGKKNYGFLYDDKGNTLFLLEYNKGKEYYYNAQLMFKGEYYNGKRWNGVIYDYLGRKECEIKYGKGIIKEYNKNGRKRRRILY